MFKDYIILDNALENPHEVKNVILKQPFDTVEDFDLPGAIIDRSLNTPKSMWRGFRTQDLTKKYPEKCEKIMHDMLKRVFNIKYAFQCSMYGHVSTYKMNSLVPKDKRWHRDNNELFAGVVYLSETPKPGTGTWLDLGNKKIHLTNKFNRMVMYKASVRHRPGNMFGTTAQDSRLTLTFFLTGIKFSLTEI